MIRRILEGRAARICAVAVTVFLCTLTLLEFTALELEWEIPVLQVVSGEHSFWNEEYRREEQALDDSTENELLAEQDAAGTGGTAAGKANEAAGDTSGIAAGTAGSAGEEANEAAGEPELADEGSGKTEGTADPVAGDADAAEGNTGESGGEDAADESSAGTDTPATEFPYYIRVNRQQNCITIYTQDEEGEYTVPHKAMVCSTGLYNATPRGTFQISTKYLWRELYGGVYGQYATRIYGGILFHSVPYYKKTKDSLCTDKYNKLGQQASMGCVRLTVEDAKWIAEHCPTGTTVEIYEDDDPGPLGKPEPMKIDPDDPNKGWDPTDPDEDNPWRELSEDRYINEK